MPKKLFFSKDGTLAVWNTETASLETLVPQASLDMPRHVSGVLVVENSEPDGGDRLFLEVRSIGLWTSDGSDAGTVQVAGVSLDEIDLGGASVVRETGGRTVYDIYLRSDRGDWPAGRVGVVRTDAATDTNAANDFTTFTLSGPAGAVSTSPFIAVGGGNYKFIGGTLNWIAPGGRGAAIASGLTDTSYAVDEAGDRLFFVRGDEIVAANGAAIQRITNDTAAYRWTLAGGNGIVGAVGDAGVVFEATRIDLNPNDATDWSGTGLWSYTPSGGFRDLRPNDRLKSVTVSRQLEGDEKPLYFFDTSNDLWVTDGTAAGTTLVSTNQVAQKLTWAIAWGDVMFVNLAYNTYRVEDGVATFFMEGEIGTAEEVDGVLYFTHRAPNALANLYRMEPGERPELIVRGVSGYYFAAADVKRNEVPTINGTDGGDVMVGTAGRERIVAGAGDDMIRGSFGADTLDGEAGSDIVDYSSSPRADPDDPDSVGKTGVTVVLGSFGRGGHATGDRYSGIEHVLGTMFDDAIYGDAAANRFDGRGGSDYLFGAAGNDTLVGNGAGSAWDTLGGGTGDDVYIVDSREHWISEAQNAGTDVVLARSGFTLSNSAWLENLIALDSGSTAGRNFGGNQYANVIIATAGPNAIHPGAKANGQGDGQRDLMRGLGGNDRYTVLDGLDYVSEADPTAGGVDSVYASVSFSLSSDRARGAVENLFLQTDADLVGVGNALANTIVGNAGSNTLSGLDGDDVVRGGSGNDVLFGDNGRDMLDGGTGDDYLVGGAGADVIIFGEGVDAFEGFEDSRPRRSTYDGLDLIDVTGLRSRNGGDPLSLDDFIVRAETFGLVILLDRNQDAVPDRIDIDRDGTRDYAVLTLLDRTRVNAEDFLF